MLAAIAPYTEEGVEIRDAGELRVKESDRIDAMAATLRAFGAVVEVFTDGLKIAGAQQSHGTLIDSGGDHRIAMAAAITALAPAGLPRLATRKPPAFLIRASLFSDLDPPYRRIVLAIFL